ncbi:Hypothetical predicted protein [Cloeon dipterum]|uniref:C-type lectin domain-containing protein n=1 Tax=Cloeon dipterum TaxID=197152 RepID=A0A8S1CPL1_9INSE|nr:Hypothetical predicted protein [Cloeon dipterum]
MSRNLLCCIFVGLLFLCVDADIRQQQQGQQHVSLNKNADLDNHRDVGDEDFLSTSIFGVLNVMLTQVQEINQKVEPSTPNTCPAQEGKEKLTALTESVKYLLNITETLNNEFRELKRSQGEGCKRNCRNLEPPSDLAKKVDCLAIGINLDLKRLVSGTFYYDKTTLLTWYEVKNFCKLHGLEMATLDTREKAKEVFSAGIVGGQGYWVAANDINQPSGDFRWIHNGSKVQTEAWLPGYPAVYKFGQQTCAVLWQNLLFDHPCGVKDRYVLCEMPKECHDILKFA